jgi:predicted metal-dependent hydrolase
MTDSGALLERSRVQFGLTPIEYKIQRSHRRTTISIAIDPDVGVLVTAPRLVARERLDQVVLTKGHWIARGLRHLSDRPPANHSKEFVSGEGFYYLGRQYRLRLETGPIRPLRLENGILTLPVPPGLSEANVEGYARAALVDWYRGRAGKYLKARCRAWAHKLKVEPQALALSEPATRWGSTSKDGTIRLNWRIVQAPSTLVDYVVAHELCHLVHRDHGREFWSMLGRVMPDYEARKQRLREVGPGMIW